MLSIQYSIISKDFYNVFRRVVRVWRSIQARKCSGEYHGMKELLGDNSEFFLAVKCPACPQPGFNMHWRVDVSEENKYAKIIYSHWE